MTFIAFNLKDFHEQLANGRTMTGVKFIRAKNLQKAKEFMTVHYPENAWAVVPKITFDKGIVYYTGGNTHD